MEFLHFKPGLVGGHCTGVDPYYLAHKAIEFDYHPEIILAGRRMNDSMGNYVASQTVKQLLKKDFKVKDSEILVLGFAFKENCTDFRNTKVIDIVKNLQEFGANVTVFDSWINTESAEKEYKTKVTKSLPNQKFDAIILAVPHSDILTIELSNLLVENGIIFDVKGVLPKYENVFSL
jgi:UDP-N-acetyl-D-galactosamine dehydrogenase